MQLFWGALSDRIGRKPTLFLGLIFYIVGSTLCALSHTIGFLIFSRVLQAAGASAGLVMAMSMVRDKFTDHAEMSKIFALMFSVMMCIPVIAPVVGSWFLTWLGWRSNFVFLAVYGVVLAVATSFVAETHHVHKRQVMKMNALCSAYVHQLVHRPFLLPTIAVSMNFAALFAFISGSSIIYIHLYHLTAYQFGLFFALNAGALVAGGMFVRYAKSKINDKLLVWSALVLALGGSLSMIIFMRIFDMSPWALAIPCFFATLGIGVLFPELTSYALKHVLKHNGLASSLVGSVRYMLAAIVGVIMGAAITYSALPLAIIMLSFSVVTLVCVMVYFLMGYHEN